MIIAILIILGLVGLLFTFNNLLGFIFNQFYILFAIGMIIEKYFDNKFLNKNGTVFFVLSIILLLIAMLFNDYSNIFKDENYIPRQFLYILNFQLPRIIIWGSVAAIFIVSFCIFFKNKKEIPWLRKLGDISYSIYLVHTFLFIIKNSFRALDHKIFDYIMFVLIIPISFLTYNIIEIQFTRWLKQRITS